MAESDYKFKKYFDQFYLYTKTVSLCFRKGFRIKKKG